MEVKVEYCIGGGAECRFKQLEELFRRKAGQNEVKSDSAPFVSVLWFK